MNAPHQYDLCLPQRPIRDRIPALKAEVSAMQQKIERTKAALAVRQNKLNRLLAQSALNADAGAGPHDAD